ncbi:MAG: histone deacetylase [Thermoguttaceae bacterium]|jgi:acetoin utilization deacetylase AcuC-like enzyme
MTLLYDDPCFLGHATGQHPERAARLRAIAERLQATGLGDRCVRPELKPCDRRRLARVHSPKYIDEIWALAKSGGGYVDADTIVSPASYDVALMAAGSVVDAVERVLRGEDRTALCLVRPPGHHAMVDRAMGFCLFNNIAIGAKVAAEEFRLDRILIVDFDIHHCNGTQATFWEDPRVGLLSIHRWPFYPGTGSEDEEGGGRARGTKLNLPIEFGTPREDTLAAFASNLQKFADRMKPQLVLASAGFDAHVKDPVGNLGLETEDFVTITDLILEVARAHSGGRLVSVLEGGYNPPVLAECVGDHLQRMLEPK